MSDYLILIAIVGLLLAYVFFATSETYHNYLNPNSGLLRRRPAMTEAERHEQKFQRDLEVTRNRLKAGGRRR